MKFTKEQITKMRALTNFVLIRLFSLNEEIETKGGLKLQVDTSYNTFDHVPISGEVVSAPTQLVFGRYSDGRVRDNSMEWKTVPELKKGDVVYFEHLASIQALGRKIDVIKDPHEVNEKYMVDEDGDTYIFIEYKDIHTAIRGNKIIPINGYVLCEPVELEESEKLEAKFVHIPEQFLPKESRKYMRVAHIGRPNDRYIEDKFTDSNSELSEGDVVLVYKFNHVPFEQSLHRHFSKDKKFFRVQGRYIKAILNKELAGEHGDKWNVGLKDEESAEIG